MTSFYSKEELLQIGFLTVGDNVIISRKASIYSPQLISIGNNVRVDDFCILSGKITLGSYIHIAAFSAIYGSDAGVTISDFANISSRVSIYSVSDDYTGEGMTNPMVEEKFKKTEKAPVHIGKHVIVGATSVILPGSVLNDGASFGAFSLIKGVYEEFTINTGVPAKKVKNRSKNLLEKEILFKEEKGI